MYIKQQNFNVMSNTIIETNDENLRGVAYKGMLGKEISPFDVATGETNVLSDDEFNSFFGKNIALKYLMKHEVNKGKQKKEYNKKDEDAQHKKMISDIKSSIKSSGESEDLNNINDLIGENDEQNPLESLFKPSNAENPIKEENNLVDNQNLSSKLINKDVMVEMMTNIFRNELIKMFK